ncbi:ParM/StbA family protein [Clostridium butyricum]|uniref:ParM/StbA family protein n=2 Tax=Clostridium butyricum TaxID=1492 RepID=UPI002AB00F4D|nr:ParM/StbA family protein [Clostridium butyricum]
MMTVIDLGNFNVKYKGENIGIFSSKYHTNFEPNEASFNRIEYEGRKYYIGVGSYSLEYTKVNKECLIPQVLYAVSKANEGNNITTNLFILMPIEQMPKKDDVIHIFERKFFSCKVNDKTVNIRIEKVIVLPECQVSRYSLDKVPDDILIIDIGSRTINFAAYCNDELIMNGTSRIGIINLYEKIMMIENSNNNDYVLEDIEPQIRRGKIKVKNDIYVNFLKEVINSIKTKVSIDKYDVVFTGGGALVLKAVIDTIDDVSIHNEPVYGNLLGAYEVCKELIK